ncbi:hypothetical protein Scep_019611 [Stephania cephalantha]|uniref:Uncharacterized protein n=1 Tax=Stephania cephalantha TaxID=152367 RepID=A0AAP0IBC3_9MAGN
MSIREVFKNEMNGGVLRILAVVGNYKQPRIVKRNKRLQRRRLHVHALLREMVYRTRHYRSTSRTHVLAVMRVGATFESFESSEKGPNEQENRSTTAPCPIPGSSSGATSGNVEESEDDPSVHLPDGHMDRS